MSKKLIDGLVDLDSLTFDFLGTSYSRMPETEKMLLGNEILNSLYNHFGIAGRAPTMSSHENICESLDYNVKYVAKKNPSALRDAILKGVQNYKIIKKTGKKKDILGRTIYTITQ